MNNINLSILTRLELAKLSLSSEAIQLIRSFVQSKLHPEGGFVDRSGMADPYYSVFGYTLCYVFDLKLDLKKNFSWLDSCQKNEKLDFVHSLSILRCYFLLEALKYTQKFGRLSELVSRNSFIRTSIGKAIAIKIRKDQSKLINLVNQYKSKDKGYNHLKKNDEQASIYANFLIMGLFEDLNLTKNGFSDIIKSSLDLQLENGSFVNHPASKQGVSSTTAAGIIIMLHSDNYITHSTDWLIEQIGPHGGFFAGEEVPVADVLSTSTSLFALSLANETNEEMAKKAVDFVNLHWEESGGFFGSAADQIPDIEYTFYALLALGCYYAEIP